MGRGDNGKTEAWVVLEAAPGSLIYAGLKPGVDREALEEHLDRGTVEECLHSFSPRPGDAVFVPAGTVHALGEGLLLVEVQQSSDVTFRLFDWNRLGEDGKPRQLHRTEALACIDFARGPVNAVVPKPIENDPNETEELVRCDSFVMRRHALSAPLSLAGGRFHVLMPLAGRFDVRTAGESTQIRLGDTLLVPADATETVVSAVDSGSERPTLLEVFQEPRTN